MHSSYNTLKIEIAERIALLTLNRPEVLNALNNETLDELEKAFHELNASESAGAVILTGAGEKAFCAGADVRELAKLDALGARHQALRGQRVMDVIEASGKPVIAAVNGVALGGGCELAMACHVRIAAEEARFGQPEVKLGIIPGYGGTQRLTRLVGKGAAMEMVLSGDMVSAQEAQRLGLVNRLAPRSELLSVCRKLAGTFLSNGPLALRYSIEAINRGQEMPQSDALVLEASLFSLSFASADMQEGMRAFVEKRKAQFQGK
ncbi:MAG: enoyl-CoA hydratase/isomerase family protein [Acidobacteria bacterium]|nr:enoyl-CoA hydratase/isomerase family protein [Acidobacteriota bacterium]